VSVGTFWAPNFWADGFWSDGFWGDLAPTAALPTIVNTDVTLDRADHGLTYAPAPRDLTFETMARDVVAGWDS
jgi:hypothetical protein